MSSYLVLYIAYGCMILFVTLPCFALLLAD